ncbi:MAG: hypothetical protein JW953_08480 [Anaerolineae bacterium]|nr:hypothetical protein [Anaerolineae bacterium]
MAVSKDHYLNLKNGVFETTSKADLDHLFAVLADDPHRERLVVHFHGGLVTAQNALHTIENRLLDAYQAAGGYPVFFVWHSGPVEVVVHNLAEIFREPIFKRLLVRVLQFVEAKLRQQPGERGGRLELKDEAAIQRELRQPPAGGEPLAGLAPTRLPVDERLREAEAEQFREVLEMDYTLGQEAEAIARGLRTTAEIARDAAARSGAVQASRHTLMSPEVLAEIEREAPSPAERGVISTGVIIRGAGRILARVIQRLAGRRDHGVYCTAVEEILREFYLANAGKLVWDWVKRDTADAFGPDPAWHGGTAFLETLKQHWQSGCRPRIILIGHSTGAIYICHFLTHAARYLPPEVQFDLVFLAPACDFRLLADTLALCGERIQNFRLFGMQDALEAADHLVPVAPVYPRSLLYFVSGVLEDEADKPLVGMQRYYSGQPPYHGQAYPEIEIVRRFVRAEAGRTIWSRQDSGPGCASTAEAHGAFDDEDVTTLNSVKHIIAEGF